MNRTFPINLPLAARKCLVVGGGRVARRKVASLLECGAHVTVVSPEFCDELAALDGVRRVQRPFDDADAADTTLVFAATSDPEVNRRVADAAHRHGALVNVVDTPAECDFIVPSVLARGDLTIAVCSGGSAPALSKRVRRELEDQFPAHFADFVALLADLRTTVMSRVPDIATRKTIFHKLADVATWNTFEQAGPDPVRELANQLVEEGA